ncbi:MAG: DNA polymerase III subunit delta [Acidobacteria bacterium]|nr:DNA polymerase III subunit delta [Acidobacteriota bacterium]
MRPQEFLARMRTRQFGPAYLLLGSDIYQSRRCRRALLDHFLGEDQSGFARHDLRQSALAGLLDEARSLSLFAPQRVIAAVNAEAAITGSAAPLAGYLENPTPGVVLLFEAARYDFEGEDKKKLEQVRAFYAGVAAVELRRLTAAEARSEAVAMARQAGVALSPDALELLVEAAGADAACIQVEIEKLSLYGKQIGREQVEALVPDARASSIFSLVNALGRRDRAAALDVLDTLCRDSQYLPLALSFLSTQLRTALVAQEAGLRSPRQVQEHFHTWPSRAEQVYQTAARFSKQQLVRALGRIFETDRGLRDARPDDRVVMEKMIFELTG